MNTLCQDQTPSRITLSLSQPQRAPAAPAASAPASNSPPELKLGAVACVIDQAGVIVAAEPLCTALFQWEPVELIDQPLELLLVAGTDKIRQHLVPDPGPFGPDGGLQPRLFALAQRKDGTSFPVAVTLEQPVPEAGSWWAVAFHDVDAPPVAQAEARVVGSLPPASTPPPDWAQAAAPLRLESIPDIFLQAPAKAAPQPEPPVPAPAAAPAPPAPASRTELRPEHPAPVAPPAAPAPASADPRRHDPEQRQAQSQPAPALAPAPSADELALQEQLLELESRLRTAVGSLARTTAELETERGERHRSEQRAATLAGQMQQLHEELKGHLAAEQLDHQRLSQLEHQLHEQAQQSDIAVAKLQSAVELEQCERKRLEAEVLRTRLSDSARSGRAQVNGLRRQLQPPVEGLQQCARRLLQLQLSEDQKQLAQAMLEHTLLLQTSLQETPEA